MNRFTKLCITVLLVLLITILTNNCATSNLVKPMCRHNALYQAIVAKDLLNTSVRIAIGPVVGTSIRHAQTQAFINSKWCWLGQGVNGVGVCTKYRGFEPDRYLTLEEAIDRYVWKVELTLLSGQELLD